MTKIHCLLPNMIMAVHKPHTWYEPIWNASILFWPIMVCLDWGRGKGSRVEKNWPKISLFSANSALFPSTSPPSPLNPNRPQCDSVESQGFKPPFHWNLVHHWYWLRWHWPVVGLNDGIKILGTCQNFVSNWKEYNHQSNNEGCYH